MSRVRLIVSLLLLVSAGSLHAQEALPPARTVAVMEFELIDDMREFESAEALRALGGPAQQQRSVMAAWYSLHGRCHRGGQGLQALTPWGVDLKERPSPGAWHGRCMD